MTRIYRIWLLILAVGCLWAPCIAMADDDGYVVDMKIEDAKGLIYSTLLRHYRPKDISRPGIDNSRFFVNAHYFLDYWDTTVIVSRIDYIYASERHEGVMISYDGSGSSFLRGQLAYNDFVDDLTRTLAKTAQVRPPSSVQIVAMGSTENTPPDTRREPGDQEAGTGTGFLVEDGTTIITANHVVRGARQIRVFCGGAAPQSAIVVKKDPANDIAMLKVGETYSVSLGFARDGSVRTGDHVFTIGFPAPDLLGREGKYTEGVISSLSGVSDAVNEYQFTAPVQPGNSGGALVNERGEVIGLITSTAAAANFIHETGALPQNVNWAVKGEYIKPILTQARVLPARATTTSVIDYIKQATCLVEVNGKG